MSLADTYTAGAQVALDRYHIKEALLPQWDPNASFGTQVARTFIGHPDVLLKERGKLFQPGAPFNLKTLFWPGAKYGPIFKWLGRLGTIQTGVSILNALRGKGDPNENRLSNALSAAGGTLGAVYGGQALGLLGAPVGSGLGAAAGRHIGRLVGGPPSPPRPAPEEMTRFLSQGDSV